MSRKLFNLISTIITCVSMAAIAFVTYFNPGPAEAINSSIAIAEGAAIAICSNFVKEM